MAKSTAQGLRLRRTSAGLAALGLFGMVLATMPSQAATTAAVASAPASTTVNRPNQDVQQATRTSVTLITGETVNFAQFADGRTGVTVLDPATTTGGTSFMQYEDPAGDLHVVPGDIARLIPSALDPALFNVSALIRDGYDDSTTDVLPLIVTYEAAPVTVPGTTTVRPLDSIDGASVALAKAQAGTLGRAIDDAVVAARATPGSDGFVAGVEKIWLDGRVEASLDESVPQIGAPTAWDLGYDGTGVTVAVLDSGIDASHPDLVDSVIDAANFTDSDSATDRFGHGTHVASIAAGTGAASDGQYTGVAYGASLLNGKVLNDFGFGLDSWVIAGMEWAAIEQDADVVNMSLGSQPTDGTDPVSQALNQLSADEGALFVAAAGNFGYGQPHTISAPASADSALAVGAVDKQEALADFSGLGPRLGDYAVKPEITGPGVDITAAMADGASIGPPVGDDYATSSGTSMSAPHVAGAAALLAQQHPDWIGQQLKAALATSASPQPGYTVWQQGGGRVDVAAATAQQVHTDKGTISFGLLSYPHDDGETVTETVTFTNPGDEAIDVSVELDVQDEEGNPAEPGLFVVTPSTLSLAPGGSALAEVTVDPAVGASGLYSGELLATAAGDDLLQVPLGLYKEPESYDLTIETIGREGGATEFFGAIHVLNVDDGNMYNELFFVSDPGGATVTARVPRGTYSVGLQSRRELSAVEVELVTVDEPQLQVSEDVFVTLDSRDAVPVEVDVGEPTDLLAALIGTHRSPEVGAAFTGSFGAAGMETIRVFATPTETVSKGEYEYYSKWSLRSAQRAYDLIFPEPGRVPDDLSYEVGPDSVALVTSIFRSHVPNRVYGTTRFGFRPYSGVDLGVFTETPVPGQRQDWVSGGDTRWKQVVFAGDFLAVGEIEEPFAEYAAGNEYSRRWYRQPVRPGVAEGISSVRSDDALELLLFEFMDAENNYGFQDPGFGAPSVDEVHFSLSAGGDVLAEGTSPFGTFELLPDPAEYEIALDVVRTAEWWRMSTETNTVWTFESERPPAGEQEAIPLLQVDYGIDLDLLNTTTTPTPITFEVYHQPGAEAGAISSLAVQASLDDGDFWSDIEVEDLGDGRFEGIIEPSGPCDPDCFVSLRAQASDEDGNSIDQTIVRAYQAAPAPPTPTPTPSPTPTEPTPTPTGPTPTDPTPTEPTPTDATPTEPSGMPTTTLPGTGGGGAGALAGLGLAGLALGGLLVVIARRRLSDTD